jgi:hypothetical protein
MTKCRGKTTCKIEDEITTTPSREPAMKITPNAKQSGREQDPPKKGKHIKKKELEELFRTGDRVPPPSTKGTPIDTVINQRKQRNDGHKDGAENNSFDDTNITNWKGERTSSNDRKKIPHQEVHKGETSNIKANQAEKKRRSMTKPTKGNKEAGRKGEDKTTGQGKETTLKRKTMAVAADQEQNQKEKEGEVVNLEAMATPLRLKGKAQSSRKKSVKKTPKAEKGKKPSPKKTTFADVVGTRQVPKPPEVEYNKCVVRFGDQSRQGQEYERGI